MRSIHSEFSSASAVARSAGTSFIVLFMLDALARATLVTVVPLQAYALLEDAQSVSLLYFLVSVAGLAGSLSVPWLVGKLQRRWTLTLGVLCVVVAAPLLASRTLVTLVTGIGLQMFGGASISICLNLYILHHIPRQTFTRFEPKRMLFSGISWMIGPVLGVYLQSHVVAWAPYAVSAVFALLMLVCFWTLRLTRSPVVPPATRAPASPVRFIPRFFSQPRLVLAWLLAMGRAGWWGMFYIYAPIFAVASGLGEAAGGWISSGGSAALFAVTFWGWIGRRFGLRWLLITGYSATGAFTLLAGVMAGIPWLSAVLLVAAAVGASITDGAGNVPFLRAVRARERAEMTTVFATYRDVARLSSPALYSVLLLVFTLPVVFVTNGAIMFALARLSSHIPRRLGRESLSA